MKRVVKLAIGWGFVGLGIIGCFLPILQGFLFMAIGFFFLAEESPFFKKYIARLEQRYPEQMRKVHTFRESMKQQFRRFLHPRK